MSSAKGKTAELIVQARMVSYGHEVLVPAHEYGPIDIAWRSLGKDGMHSNLITAQIKAVYKKKGRSTINLVRSSGARYRHTDVDYLFAVGDGFIWMIPFHLVAGYSRLSLGDKWVRFRHRLEDWEWE